MEWVRETQTSLIHKLANPKGVCVNKLEKSFMFIPIYILMKVYGFLDLYAALEKMGNQGSTFQGNFVIWSKIFINWRKMLVFYVKK